MPQQNNYKIVTYSMGKIVLELDNLSYEEAREYYKNNMSDWSNSSMRLFKNGQKIPYTDTLKELDITFSCVGCPR